MINIVLKQISKKGGHTVKVDSWFHSNFQKGSRVTYLRKYKNCLKDQYRILDVLYNFFNHLRSNDKYTASLKSGKN